MNNKNDKKYIDNILQKTDIEMKEIIIDKNINTDMKDNIIDKNINNDMKEIIIDKNINGYPAKLGYKDIETYIRNSYYSKQDYYSIAFDIIATFLKGQKMIYIEAHTHCVTRLNMLCYQLYFYQQ